MKVGLSSDKNTRCGRPTMSCLNSKENPSESSGSFVSPRDDGARTSITGCWIKAFLGQLRDLLDLSATTDPSSWTAAESIKITGTRELKKDTRQNLVEITKHALIFQGIQNTATKIVSQISTKGMRRDGCAGNRKSNCAQVRLSRRNNRDEDNM